MDDSKDIVDVNKNIYSTIQQLRYAVDSFNNNHDADFQITSEEHCDRMYKMLDAIKVALQDTEYSYTLEAISGKIISLDNFVVSLTALTKDVFVFQPLDNEVTQVDMESLSDILNKMVNAGKIPGNVLILPPDVNIIKAKFKCPE